MPTLIVILRVLALVCFVAATVEVPARINWIGAGLALWMLTIISVL